MKTNVNLFIALILCAVIGGALYFLARPSQEDLSWNPDEMYGDLSRSAYDGSAFTNATFSGSPNAGGVALSMQGGSLSSRTRAKSSRPITIQYPIANSPSPIANTQYPIANGPSPIAYMTSGAEYRSFGGGGNGNMGAADSFRTNSQSPIANGASSINYTLPVINGMAKENKSSSYYTAASSIADNPTMSANIGSGLDYSSFYATSSADAGLTKTSSYNGIGRSNVRGRQNAGITDWWLDWLNSYGTGYGDIYGHDYDKDGNIISTYYTFTEDQFKEAYIEFVKYWQKMWGPESNIPTFEVWYAWLKAGGKGGYEHDGNWFIAPVGDVFPLLLLAMLYIVVLLVKRNKNCTIMIKKIFSALCVVLFATSMMAQTGLTCEDAIPVDKNYRATIDGPCEIWYTASTYDLPIHVYFSPVVDDSDWGPEVQVDLTCVPGVYEDRKIDSLINLVSDFEVSFPLEFLSELVVRNGKNEWDLSVSKTYRDNMAEFGVTYPVQAFVKVTYFEAGTVSLTPDTAFTSCMDNATHVKLSDTIDIAANDAERVFVFPYSDWQEDSIRFVWTGEQPAAVYVAVQECNFTASATNPYVFDNFTIAQDVPHKMYSEGMKADIDKQKEGGIYYAKVVAPCAGEFVVEQIPLSEIEGGAQLLEYGQEVPISAVSEQLYCFPKTWTATEFSAPIAGNVQLFVSTTYDFEASADDSNVLKVYDLELINGQRQLQFSTKEMATLTARAEGDYMYIRMLSSEPTDLSINEWIVSDCADNSTLIYPNVERSVASKSYNTIYRLRYDEFKGCSITITWSGNSTLPIFLSEDCTSGLLTHNEKLLLYPAPAIARKSQLTIDVATVNSWASRIDEDGFMYVWFNPSNTGRVKFIPERPAAPDTIYTTISETVCYGESYEWNGQSYSTAGEYKQSFVATNGADSIVTLQLTILPEVTPTTEEATIEAGESYTWNGKDYTEAGEYTITLQDKNGCDYQATLLLTVNKPLSPCLQSSIKLNVGDEVVINLDSAFTVYAIDYAAWMAQPVTLVWTGAEALHTFVAETCVFALAPYNKYVHAYVPVPAQGDSALDMEALAAYVDEDGYLYVRFLTEFEGVLTVDN